MGQISLVVFTVLMLPYILGNTIKQQYLPEEELNIARYGFQGIMNTQPLKSRSDYMGKHIHSRKGRCFDWLLGTNNGDNIFKLPDTGPTLDPSIFSLNPRTNQILLLRSPLKNEDTKYRSGNLAFSPTKTSK